VESRAQQATLPRLKPTKFYDLVVQVAIIRRGPIVGKMVHPYLARRKGDESVEPLHPLLAPVLERTLGVPLFQEQLLRMAMTVANFTGGEAEELRRAMGFKRSQERMKDIELRLRRGMEKNGITGSVQETIVQSITSFVLYGFPESHAASFALLAYASAFLKYHHLAAFTCALLNNQPMGFYHPAVVLKDAQRHGLRGIVDESGNDIADWLTEFLKREDCRDNIRKLENSGAAERHIFIMPTLNGTFIAPMFHHFEVTYALPRKAPILPPGITGAWIVPTATHTGLFWNGRLWAVVDGRG
jgi:hypothetical protein